MLLVLSLVGASMFYFYRFLFLFTFIYIDIDICYDKICVYSSYIIIYIRIYTHFLSCISIKLNIKSQKSAQHSTSTAKHKRHTRVGGWEWGWATRIRRSQSQRVNPRFFGTFGSALCLCGLHRIFAQHFKELNHPFIAPSINIAQSINQSIKS